MLNYKRIALGFALVICLMIALGSVSLFQMRNIADDVDMLYRHPFAVSNAAKSIDFHLVSMHRHMKDVVLSQDKKQLDGAIAEVSKHEVEILQYFRILAERFLGDKSQINSTYQLFLEWKPIRDDVIRMVRDGRVYEAGKITKTRGALHVQLLSSEVDKLVKFAQKKAETFHRRAQEKKNKALSHIFMLTMTTAGLAIFVAVYVIKNALKVHKERVQRIHLIDQNIMMATLDVDGKVVDLSNALCRFLRLTKEDLIGRPSNFFDNTDESEDTVKAVLRKVKTGESWKGEIKRFCSDGQIHWARSSVIPTYDEDYNLTGYTNILQDVTSKKLSVTDKLTTLYNRRRYEEVIVRELRLAKRNEVPMTLAMIDIDFFKKYNDHYGHPKGDVALSKVAEALIKKLKRPNDYAFRLGGEEFALIFSDLDEDKAKRFLEKVRQNVEDLEIEHAKSSVSDHLTISIGAHVVGADETMDEERIYVLADKALYMAKESRNTVVVTS